MGKVRNRVHRLLRKNLWLRTFNMPNKVVNDYDVAEWLSDLHEDNLQNINNFLKKDWIIIIIQSLVF